MNFNNSEIEGEFVVEAVKVKSHLNRKILRSIKNIAISFRSKMILAFITDSEMQKPVLLSMAKMLLLCSPRTNLTEEQLLKINQKKIKSIRNKIGFVLSIQPMQEEATIMESISNNEKEKEEILSILKYTNLLSKQNHKISTLSEFEKRKLSIAFALVNHPNILLVDNPTENLDCKSKKEYMDILKKLKEEGMCIIIVSTDENLHTYADESYKMIDGNFKRTNIRKSN